LDRGVRFGIPKESRGDGKQVWYYNIDLLRN
jgi:hypothetical protein